MSVASPDLTARLWPGLWHEIFNEPRQSEVLPACSGPGSPSASSRRGGAGAPERRPLTGYVSLRFQSRGGRPGRLREGQAIGVLPDELRDRLACAVAGPRLDAQQHRRRRSPGRPASVAANLNEWPGTTRSSWSPVSSSVGRIAGAGPDVVQRRVGAQPGELLGILRAAEVAGPCPADGEVMEPQHVEHADVADRRPEQLRMLSQAGADEQTAVGAAIDGSSTRDCSNPSRAASGRRRRNRRRRAACWPGGRHRARPGRTRLRLGGWRPPAARRVPSTPPSGRENDGVIGMSKPPYPYRTTGTSPLGELTFRRPGQEHRHPGSIVRSGEDLLGDVVLGIDPGREGCSSAGRSLRQVVGPHRPRFREGRHPKVHDAAARRGPAWRSRRRPAATEAAPATGISLSMVPSSS